MRSVVAWGAANRIPKGRDYVKKSLGGRMSTQPEAGESNPLIRFGPGMER